MFLNFLDFLGFSLQHGKQQCFLCFRIPTELILCINIYIAYVKVVGQSKRAMFGGIGVYIARFS